MKYLTNLPAHGTKPSNRCEIENGDKNPHISASNNPQISCSQNEDRNLLPQKEKFYLYLRDKIVTCSMVSKALEIPQKNLTRFKRQLEQSGLLWEVYKDYCEITGHKSWYITTNNSLSPKSNQLNLFDNE